MSLATPDLNLLKAADALLLELSVTHLLERKTDIRVIQVLLGHRKIDTTALYTRVALNTIQAVESALAHLRPKAPPPT